MIELKKCPFCGGKARMEEHIFYGLPNSYGVKCCACFAKTNQFYDTPKEAVEAWNKREEERVMPFGAFSVIDTKTGKYPDLQKIALKEDWAKGLMYCDMEGFAISEDGCLYLMDECGNMVVCPEGRFRVVEEANDD